VTPGLRYYTQSAASFFDPPPGPAARQPFTMDRASRVRRVHAQCRHRKVLADGWAPTFIDFWQRDNWRPAAAPASLPFSARWLIWASKRSR
jgi:hypothetical protein